MNLLKDRLLERYSPASCDLDISEQQRAAAYRVAMATPDKVYRLAERLAAAEGDDTHTGRLAALADVLAAVDAARSFVGQTRADLPTARHLFMVAAAFDEETAH
ncbi:MAG: hypothetical protein ACLQUT_06430 [Thermoleophilia bacterium]